MSATSVGRFGWWPSTPSGQSHYEEDLVARIWPDNLQRTVAGLPWTLGFGALSVGSPQPVSSVQIDSLNWISKTITVTRGTADYRVTVNCVSPGMWIETDETEIFLTSTDSLGFAAYAGQGGMRVVDLAATPLADYDRIRDGNWTENWLLLWYASDSPLLRQVPILVVLSRQPQTIRGSAREISIRFTMAPIESLLSAPERKTSSPTPRASSRSLADSVRAVLALPFGVDALDPAAVSGWFPVLPDSVVARCRSIAALCVHWPVGVTERYEIDATSKRVLVQDEFRYRDLDDAWGTQAPLHAPLSPLLSFARDHGHDIDMPDPGRIRTGYPTKYGELEVVQGTNVANYSLPLPPQHGVHLVMGGTERDWKERATGCVDFTTNALVWDLDDAEGGGAWNLATMTGSFEALLAVHPRARQRFLAKAREILAEVTLDFGPTSPYYLRVEPTTQRSYPYLIHARDHPTLPIDQDAGAGANLNFVWEYGLFSGDWAFLESKWPDIERIFSYLHLVNDWAYLASSCRDWGGCGSFLDMFPAQWMGYLSYAQIAAALGHEAERDEGLYLAARALVPLVARFQFEPYAARYYAPAFAPAGEIVSGFGESEPGGVLSNAWCEDPHRNLAWWRDKTIAGELFHPLVYDLYMRRVPAEFEALLLEGESQNGSSFNFQNGFYPENAAYAFSRIGRSRDWFEQSWARAHTAEAPAEEVFGPTLPARVAFHMALVGAYDIPVRVASWAPGVMESAWYDRRTGRLSMQLRNDTTAPAALAVLSPAAPTSVTIDGAPAPAWSYDPGWQEASLSVGGAGTHSVVLAFPFQGTEPPASATPDSNQVANGGFEECSDRPNWVRAWIQSALKCGSVAAATDSVHSGRFALRMTATCDTSDVWLHQNVYFGTNEPYTVTVWYNIPQAIPPGSFTVTLQEFQDQQEAEQYSRSFTVPADQNPSHGWQPLVIPVSSHQVADAAICRLLLRLRNAAGTVYVDDAALVSPALTDVGEPPPGDEPAGALPRATISPNPFSRGATLRWWAPAGETAEVRVYDVAGRQVRILQAMAARGGPQSLVWDGRDQRGTAVASGVYLLHLDAGGRTQTRKLLRLR